jgi:hypothetical protein
VQKTRRPEPGRQGVHDAACWLSLALYAHFLGSLENEEELFFAHLQEVSRPAGDGVGRRRG